VAVWALLLLVTSHASALQEPHLEPAQDALLADGQRTDEQRRLEQPTESRERHEEHLLERVFLGWGGLRGWLEERGLSISLLVTHDLSWTPEGGLDPGATASRALTEVTFDAESSALLGWEGGRLHVGLQWIEGEDGSAEIGALQALSNIDADDRLQIARIWYEHTFGGAFLRAGKLDANTLFAYVEHGAHFLHSSMGYSPTILGLPT
jgi:carbohydrate-selective porin OprB